MVQVSKQNHLVDLIEDFQRGYLDSSPHTWRFYRGQMRAFTAWLAAARIDDPAAITPVALRDFLDHERAQPVLYRNPRTPDADPVDSGRTLSAKSMSHRYQAAGTFLAWCVAQGHIVTNPIERVKRPKVPKRILVGYTNDEVKRMLKYAMGHEAKRHWINYRDQAILLLLLATGARANELLALRTGELDFQRRRVLLHGKGGRDRLMPMGEKSALALRDYLRVRPKLPSDAVFVTLFGDPMEYDALRDLLLRLEEYADVQDISAHRFRRTYAAAHYERNRDLIALQHALDHASVATTMVYLNGLGFSFHERAQHPDPTEWLS